MCLKALQHDGLISHWYKHNDVDGLCDDVHGPNMYMSDKGYTRNSRLDNNPNTMNCSKDDIPVTKNDCRLSGYCNTPAHKYNSDHTCTGFRQPAPEPDFGNRVQLLPLLRPEIRPYLKPIG